MEAMLLLTAGVVLARWAFGVLALDVDPVFAALGAALLWMVAGLAVAEDQFFVVRTVLMWSAFALVALYVSNARPEQIRQVLWAIVVAAAATAAIAVLSGTTQEARAGATAVEGRAQGSFTHPNQLAFFLVMALPCALVLAVRERLAARWAAAGLSILLIVALMLTLTRGAIIGATVSLAIMLVWAPFRKVAAVALVGLALFAVLNADTLSRSQQLNLVGARLGTVFNRDEATVNNGRLQIWAKVPQIAREHPVFGLGVGNFKEHSLEYGLSEGGRGFLHAHNVALTVLVEQGIVGFGLLLLVLFLIGRHTAAALARRSHPEFAYALAPIAGLGGLFVNSLTDYPPGSNPNMALLLIEIGLLVAATRALRQPPA
jgi:O-antigen ligase